MVLHLLIRGNFGHEKFMVKVLYEPLRVGYVVDNSHKYICLFVYLSITLNE